MLSRRLMLLVLAAACATCLALPAIGSAAVPGTSAWRTAGVRELGPMKSRKMTFTLVLKPRHAAALKRFVASRHAALRPAQFNARYAPSAATVKAVRKWARAHELRVSSVSANRMLVRVSGSSPAVARALRTHFANFTGSGTGRYTQISSAARLPKAFAGQVGAVLGLSSLAHLSLPKPAHRSGSGKKALGRAKLTLPHPDPAERAGARLPEPVRPPGLLVDV